MSEQTDQGRDDSTEGGSPEGAPVDDGFPAEDVMPEETDPDMDVADPFGVGDDREPLEGEPTGGDGTDRSDTDQPDTEELDELED